MPTFIWDFEVPPMVCTSTVMEGNWVLSIRSELYDFCYAHVASVHPVRPVYPCQALFCKAQEWGRASGRQTELTYLGLQIRPYTELQFQLVLWTSYSCSLLCTPHLPECVSILIFKLWCLCFWLYNAQYVWISQRALFSGQLRNFCVDSLKITVTTSQFWILTIILFCLTSTPKNKGSAVLELFRTAYGMV